MGQQQQQQQQQQHQNEFEIKEDPKISNISSSSAKPRNNKILIDPITILPTITIACIFSLITGVLYMKANNPNTYFDIDFYMALDGVIGNNAATELDPSSMPESTIIELPPLSPAEQLVGAIFGPP